MSAIGNEPQVSLNFKREAYSTRTGDLEIIGLCQIL